MTQTRHLDMKCLFRTLLFGENRNEKRLDYLLSHNRIASKESKEILSAVHHPEMHEVIIELQRQVQKDLSTVRYCWLHNSRSLGAYIGASKRNFQEVLLFTDWSYFTGFFSYFCEVVERAFPNYSLDSKQSIGEVVMRKKKKRTCP